MNRISRIYLDYAASTPVDSLVFNAMKPYFSEKFGNPGSVQSFGQEAIAAVDISRETIARTIGSEFRNIIFTGSATEANNFAIRASVKKYLSEHKTDDARPRLIISSVEHESVLETARELENKGVEVIFLPVDKNGIVNLQMLESSLNDHTILVSVMYANNEIGTIQPITEISKIIKDFKSRQPSIANLQSLLFHTDAVQAFQFLDCNVKELGVDMMTLSAHKIYGPKGIGCLYLRQPLASIMSGGGQEFGMRSGTENVPSIVGFSKAVEIRSHLLRRANKQISGLRDYLWRGMKRIRPNVILNGGTGRNFLPNILNVYFPGQEAQDILTRLDLQGVAASSGSACRSRAIEASYVITALGYAKERANSSIRFSLGRPTTKKDINRALAVIKMVVSVK